MFSGETMSFLESLTISGLGIAVVFTALVTLAVAIVVISKVIGLFVREKTPAAAALPTVDNTEKDNETFAVLMATISEDMNLPMDQFRIVSIKEV